MLVWAGPKELFIVMYIFTVLIISAVGPFLHFADSSFVNVISEVNKLILTLKNIAHLY